MRYHISFPAGVVNICKAKSKCPFGDLEEDHFDSAEEARESFEHSMAYKESNSRTLKTYENTIEAYKKAPQIKFKGR